MTGLPLVLASLLIVYLVFVQPLLGYRSFQRLLQKLEVDPKARSWFYMRGIVLKWVLVSVVAVILALARLPGEVIGLRVPRDLAPTLLWILYAVILLVISTWMFRRRARTPEGYAQLERLLLAPIKMLPATGEERALWVAAAATAGICEEILYRGFMMFYLVAVFPRLGMPGAIILSSLFFGAAHFYQGLRGILATGFIGLILAWFYAMTGSLLLPIVVHGLIDLRAMYLFPWKKASRPV